jgi:Fe-S-cluster-containing hydrogenase component 2
MAKVEVAKVGQCVGCCTCEIVCSLTHEDECRPSLSKIKVHMDGLTQETTVEIGQECDLCDGKVECVRWCPAGVLKYIKKGA